MTILALWVLSWILISTPDSKVQVWVIPTNEELMIAQDTAELVNSVK